MKYLLLLSLISSITYPMLDDCCIVEEAGDFIIDKIMEGKSLGEILSRISADKSGYARAFERAINRGREDVACLLILEGLDSNLPIANTESGDVSWKTPLLMAAEKNMCALACVLLDKGANVDDQNNPNKMTVLMTAADKAHVEMVGFLLSANANANLVNKWSMSALGYSFDPNIQEEEKVRQKRSRITHLIFNALRNKPKN